MVSLLSSLACLRSSEEVARPIKVSTHAAVAHGTATAPMWSTSGSRAVLPSCRPAIAYMPSGKTTVHMSAR